MTTTARLTGITAGAGQCDCCGRTIKVRRFTVRYASGAEAILGRACAAKATGWAAIRLERAVEAEKAIAAKVAADRIAGVTLEAMIERQMRGGASRGYAETAAAQWHAMVYPEAVTA